MSQHFSQTIEGCFGPSMLDEGQYEACLRQLSPVLEELKSGGCVPTKALLDLAKRTDDLPQIQALAEKIKSKYAHVVVCGSGGSGLSGKIFSQLKTPALDMHFLENIDPDLVECTLSKIDLRKCFFIIISKSGGTVETLSQFYILAEKVEQAGGSVAQQFAAITMDTKSKLKDAIKTYGLSWLKHPADVGGRFSALTAVGLLPAALCGLDIVALRQGAADVVAQLNAAHDSAECFAAQSAALQMAAIQSGRNITVMWPYGERLAGFSAWFRQSWAESLGKAGKGSTPHAAMGTTDQHSQLQLFLDGPKDKLFTVITLPREGTGPVITPPDAVSHLTGKTLGDVMAAQQEATITTLTKNDCPVRHIHLDVLNEQSFAALLMQGTLEIAFMAKLLDVNPYDQPAVEESKDLARASLARGAA